MLLAVYFDAGYADLSIGARSDITLLCSLQRSGRAALGPSPVVLFLVAFQSGTVVLTPLFVNLDIALCRKVNRSRMLSVMHEVRY